MSKNNSAMFSMVCFFLSAILFVVAGEVKMAWASAILFLLSSVNLD